MSRYNRPMRRYSSQAVVCSYCGKAIHGEARMVEGGQVLHMLCIRPWKEREAK